MKLFSTKYIDFLLHGLFLVSSAITLFIVFKDIDHFYSFVFVVGYVVFLILYFIYLFIKTIINVKKLKWIQIRKRLYRLLTYFIFFSFMNIIYYYFSKSVEIDYYRSFSIVFGISLGISFLDLAFTKEPHETKV